MADSTTYTTAQFARRTVLMAVGLVGFTLSLTVLFLSMRAVMEIGGSCASGGPYVVDRPCPQGVGWLTPLSVFTGLGFLLLYAANTFPDGGPRLAVLAWPALFLSLGWNFLEYGLDPPGDAGTEWSWIVCGVVFVIMGGLPLYIAIRAHGRDGVRAIIWGGPTGPRRETRGIRAIDSALSRRPHLRRRSSRAHTVPPPRAPGVPRTADRDLLAKIERLDALRGRGAIDDVEYESLKDELFRDHGAGP